MLINCPECELQVSDKAMSCPHCGYPLKNQSPTHRKKSTKHKRLPNGFGQISEIKNRNLRKPFRAMVSVGTQENGRPIVKMLQPEAYFKTYNEAYMALIEYNKNPYDLEPSMTMQELYEKWSEQHFKNLSKSVLNQSKQAWKYSYAIHNMRVVDVRVNHMKACIYESHLNINGEKHYPSIYVKNRIKTNLNLMFDYALENEIVDKNRARFFSLDDEISKEMHTVNNEHLSYTDEEMNTLWENINECSGVDIILIQCYSGWRPQELENIRLDNVDLDKGFITGGMKTDSGKDRIVPIHSKIRPLIEKQYGLSKEVGCDRLLTCDLKYKSNVPLTYTRYKRILDDVITKLGLNHNHKPHDGRVQFATLAKKYSVNEYALKYMMGHAINDITESVYTKREPEWLIEEIEKIK